MTSSARPILHILVRMLVRVRGGKYTARFRRKNGQIQEKIATKKMTKATIYQVAKIAIKKHILMATHETDKSFNERKLARLHKSR